MGGHAAGAPGARSAERRHAQRHCGLPREDRFDEGSRQDGERTGSPRLAHRFPPERCVDLSAARRGRDHRTPTSTSEHGPQPIPAQRSRWLARQQRGTSGISTEDSPAPSPCGCRKESVRHSGCAKQSPSSGSDGRRRCEPRSAHRLSQLQARPDDGAPRSLVSILRGTPTPGRLALRTG